MSRDWIMYLDDMIDCCRKVIKYTGDADRKTFFSDSMAYDAVLRNLEILGEAAKSIPEDVQQQRRDVEWRKIAGLRDVLAHAYFGLEEATLWDVIKNKVPNLLHVLEEIRSDLF